MPLKTNTENVAIALKVFNYVTSVITGLMMLCYALIVVKYAGSHPLCTLLAVIPYIILVLRAMGSLYDVYYKEYAVKLVLPGHIMDNLDECQHCHSNLCEIKSGLIFRHVTATYECGTSVLVTYWFNRSTMDGYKSVKASVKLSSTCKAIKLINASNEDIV